MPADFTVMRTPHTPVNKQPRTDKTAGTSKLDNRPDAADNSAAESYTVPALSSPSGNRKGVLRSQPAKL